MPVARTRGHPECFEESQFRWSTCESSRIRLDIRQVFNSIREAANASVALRPHDFHRRDCLRFGWRRRCDCQNFRTCCCGLASWKPSQPSLADIRRMRQSSFPGVTQLDCDSGGCPDSPDRPGPPRSAEPTDLTAQRTADRLALSCCSGWRCPWSGSDCPDERTGSVRRTRGSSSDCLRDSSGCRSDCQRDLPGCHSGCQHGRFCYRRAGRPCSRDDRSSHWPCSRGACSSHGPYSRDGCSNCSNRMSTAAPRDTPIRRSCSSSCGCRLRARQQPHPRRIR